ncbi:MAG: helix-turn-helix domain-containing protein [Halioglobus sp.]
MSLSALQTADFVLRIVVITELTLLAAVILRARPVGAVYRAALPLALCIIGYLLAPLLLQRSGIPQLAYPAVLLAVMVPTAFWYFCCTVFVDDFRPPLYAFGLALITAALATVGYFTGISGGLDTIDRVAQAAKLLWLAAAFYVVIRDWRADLVTSRIQLRRLLLIVAGAYIAAIMIVELFLTGPPPAALELVNSLLILALVSICVLTMLQLDDRNLLAHIATPVAGSPGTGEPSALAKRALQSMSEQRAYAMEGLSLNRLAQELNCQPQLLRQVINTELGYRNFNAFINLYRVREVAERMALPEYRDTPLLTLALDAGFRSLAPFNRSFREHYKCTPSAYRTALKKS